jgi:hypothetical protein
VDNFANSKNVLFLSFPEKFVGMIQTDMQPMEKRASFLSGPGGEVLTVRVF